MTDDAQEVTLTREQLYEQVWTTAMRLLAPQYGLSDVGLAKICRKHQVPHPPLGYWAKLQHGHKPRKTFLPKCSDPDLQTITLILGRRPAPSEPTPPEPEFDEDVQALMRRLDEMPDPQVPAPLRNPHPLVRVTRDALADAQPDQHKLLRAYRSQDVHPLCVSVSQSNVQRALLFLNAFIKAIEWLGGKVRTEEKYYQRRTVVTLCGTDIATIRVRERYRQEKRDPRSGGSYSWNTYEYTPIGKFVLDSGPSYDSACFCQDTDRQRIEDCIKRVLVRFVETVGRQRIKEREEERARKAAEAAAHIRQARMQELERRTQALLERQKTERARVDALLNDATSWQQSQTVRAYLEAVRVFVIRKHGSIEANPEIADWLKWAAAQADRLDPLSPKPPSVLDEPLPKLEEIEFPTESRNAGERS